MLFNSWQFLFVFLPITILGSSVLYRYKKSASWIIVWLLFSSIVFYGYWEFSYLALLFISILFNWSVGYAISNSPIVSQKKYLLILGVTINLAVIAYYKYADFIGGSAAYLLGNSYSSLSIILPLGISFYSFTQTAYIVDVFRGMPSEKNIFRYSLFVTIFPHLIAGPILHYQTIVPQFRSKIFGRINAENLARGLTLFALGLFKKMMIADNLAVFVKPVFDAAQLGIPLTYGEAWLGAVAYTFQLYFDFSGYSDMAVGLGWIFGIKLPWNFDSPYKSINIQEFWRRWHMTLSFFMRDYVYFSLGGSKLSTIRTYMNIVITMALCGLWHGANWTFVLWGLLHGIYMIVHRIWGLLKNKILTALQIKMSSEKDPYKTSLQSIFSTFLRGMGIALTFLAVVFAWVIFRAPSIAAAKEIYWAMIGGNGFFLPNQIVSIFGFLGGWISGYGFAADSLFGKNNIMGAAFTLPSMMFWIVLSVFVVWFLPNSRQFIDDNSDHFEYLSKDKGVFGKLELISKWKPNGAWAIILAIFTALSIMSLSNISEFLYFQF